MSKEEWIAIGTLVVLLMVFVANRKLFSRSLFKNYLSAFNPKRKNGEGKETINVIVLIKDIVAFVIAPIVSSLVLTLWAKIIISVSVVNVLTTVQSIFIAALIAFFTILATANSEASKKIGNQLSGAVFVTSLVAFIIIIALICMSQIDDTKHVIYQILSGTVLALLLFETANVLMATKRIYIIAIASKSEKENP